jgi:hypothetical protein
MHFVNVIEQLCLSALFWQRINSMLLLPTLHSTSLNSRAMPSSHDFPLPYRPLSTESHQGHCRREMGVSFRTFSRHRKTGRQHGLFQLELQCDELLS